MAQRATSLGPKPSLLVLFVCFVFLLVFFVFRNEMKNLFSPQKGHFLFIFSVSPFVSPSLFSSPFSLSLSLSLLLPFLSLFLLVFFLLLSFAVCLFLSLSFFALSSLLLFHEREQHQNIQLRSFFPQVLSVFWFPVLFSSFKSLISVSLVVLLILSCVFCSTSMFWVSRARQVDKTPILGEVGGCNKTIVDNLCFFNVKSYRFWGAEFWAKFG